MGSDTRLVRQEAMWLRIVAPLRRSISRTADSADLDDVLQDVAERFFRHRGEFDTPDEALAWTRVVARRRLIDLSRKRRAVPMAEIKVPNSVDAERSALGRLALDCALGFMRTEGIGARWVTGPEGPDPVPAIERMRRSRARRRVDEHVREKVGWAALIPRLRWLISAVGVAIVVPLPFVGLPDTRGRVDAAPSHSVAQSSHQPPTGTGSPGQATASTRAPDSRAVSTDPASPGPAEDRVIVAAPLPWGDAGISSGDGPAGPQDAPPLACVRGLRVVSEVCVDHPLR